MPDVLHTTTPWSATHWPNWSEVFGADGEPVVRTSAGYRMVKEQSRIEENVELIVRAVNAHADLLAACEALVLHLRSIGIITREEEPLVQAAEAAIAKAKGGAA